MAAITGSNVEALAKKSQNPVAKLISVPFEYNFNGEFGPNNGKQAINGRMAYYYNVEKPEFGAQWDFQLTAIFLFPE